MLLIAVAFALAAQDPSPPPADPTPVPSAPAETPIPPGAKPPVLTKEMCLTKGLSPDEKKACCKRHPELCG